MQYGQNFRCGFYDYTVKERVNAIKNAGFSSIMQWWGDDFEKQDGAKEEVVKQAKDCGLSYSALHSRSNLSSDIWKDDICGERKLEEYINVLEMCNKIECPNMVVHTTYKQDFPKMQDVGLDRFFRLVKRATELGVVVAIENTRKLEYNKFLFQNINSKNLGLCYDSGHNNCYTKDEHPLELFHDKVVVTHLHDNFGGSYKVNNVDMHNLMGDGNVDFLNIRQSLLDLNLDTICLESYCNPHSKYYGLTMQEFLNLSYKKISTFMEKGELID